jgi:hypothetical protein
MRGAVTTMNRKSLTRDSSATPVRLLRVRGAVRTDSYGRHARRPLFESLEDRTLLSSGSIVELAAGANQPQVSGPSPLAFPLGRGTASAVGLNPTQIQNAYGFGAITFQGGIQGIGTGQTIAIVDPYSDSAFVPSGTPGFEASDLGEFDKQFGLPDPTFTIDNLGTVPQQAPLPDAQGYSWAAETALDVEWVHALAPGAAIVLVETPGGTTSQLDSGLVAGVQFASKLPGVSVISISWTLGTAVSDSVFTTPAGHHGITYVAGSGDSGSPSSYPATSPNVLSVGGTYFPAALDAAGDYSGESAWDASGGGVDASEPQSTAQAQAIGAMGGRAVPDVAFDAGTSVAVYDSYDYGATTPWTSLIGTSLGAPAWSALVAIADQGRSILGQSALDGANQTIPELYSVYKQPTAYAAAFHDITSGGNNLNNEGTGYSLVTGLGTPSAAGIASLLSGDVAAPTLIAPANNAVVTTTTPTFEWSAVAGSVGYDLTVTDTTTGSQVVAYSTPASGNGTGATSYTPPNSLHEGDAFSWSVSAVTAGGQVGESPARIFVVLQVPTPVGPSGVVDSSKPTLQWASAPGASGYSVTLDDITSGKAVVTGLVVTVTSYTPTTALNNLDTYDWSVASLSMAKLNGTPFSSPPSGSVYFTVNINVAPVPTAPANGSVVTTTTPLLAWSSVPGAVSYDVTVLDDFDDTVATGRNISSTSWTTPTLSTEFGPEFFWYVSANIQENGSVISGPPSRRSSFFVSQFDQPTLISPPPDSIVSTPFPTLEWSAVAGYEPPYDVSLLDVTDDLSLIYLYQEDNNSLSINFPLLNGHSYEWSISTLVSGHDVATSAEFTVSLPSGGTEGVAAPTLIGPSAVINAAAPEFSWTSVPGATGYALFYSHQGQTPNFLPQYVVGGATSYTPPALEIGTYQWWVMAFDANLNFSPPSESLDFNVSVPYSGQPAAPTNLSPSGTVTSPVPTFQWTAVPGASDYGVVVVDETAGTIAISSSTVGRVSYTPGLHGFGSPLINGHQYRWYVDAVVIPSTGQPEFSAVATATFSVSAPLNSIAEPVFPLAGPPVDTSTPDFQWSSVPGAVGYVVYVADPTIFEIEDEFFLDGAAVTSSSYTPTLPLIDGRIYEWQVCALFDQAGVEAPGPTSDPIPFTVSVPAPPALDALGDSGTLTTATPTLEWSAVSGASGYDVYLEDTTTDTQVLDGLPVIATSYVVAAPLNNGDSYQWYVTAYDNFGDIGVAPAALDFTVDVPPTNVPTPNPTGPIGKDTTTTPTLQWTPVPMAVGYELYVNDTTLNQPIPGSPVSVPAKSGSGNVSYPLATPLPVSDSYAFYVRAVFADGSLGPAGPTDDFTVSAASDLAGPPTLDNPEGSTYSTQPSFQWSTVTNAAGYEIEIEDTTNNTIRNVLEPTQVTGTSYTMGLALTPGDTYQWEVAAYDSANIETAFSSPETFQVLLLPPTATSPSGPTNSATPTFQWSQVTASGAVSYDIRVTQSTGGTSTDVADVNDITGTQYQLSTPLLPGQTYQWQVAANYGPNLMTAWSSPPTTFHVLIPSPSPVSPLSGATTTTTPTFDWSAETGATGYQVQVLQTVNGATTTLFASSTLSGPPYTLGSSLTPGATYAWEVAAYDSSGAESVWSSPQTFDVPLPPPTPVSPLAGTTTSATPTFDWSAETGATGYQVQILQNVNGATTTIFSSSTLSGPPYTLGSSLTPGATYAWEVAAFDSSGAESAWSSPQTFHVPLPPPSPVSPLSGTTTTAKPTFDWSGETGATGYQIQILQTVNGATTTIFSSSTLSGPPYTLGFSLTPGATYAWEVAAYDSSGVESAWSSSQTFHASLPPPTPVSPLSGTTTTATPTFDWSAETGATGYQVQILQSVNGATNTLFTSNKLNGPPYTFGFSLTPGATYEWEVAAYDSSGAESFWSSPQTFNVSLPPPSPVSPLRGTTTTPTPTFDWSAEMGATGYQVQILQTINGAPTTLFTSGMQSGPPYTLAFSLMSGATYEWEVAAYDSSGAESAWSSPQTFQTLLAAPTAGPPSGVTATNTPTFSWSNVAGASGYQIQITDKTTSMMLPSVNVTGLSYTIGPSAALAAGQSYQWRVAASAGSSVVGQWSAWTSFSISATPPQAMRIVSVLHTSGKVSGFTIVFNEPLEVASADSARLYQVKPGTRKGTRVVYGNPVTIKPPSYKAGATSVTIRLAKPVAGPIEVIVLSGIIGADGIASKQSKPFQSIS